MMRAGPVAMAAAWLLAGCAGGSAMVVEPSAISNVDQRMLFPAGSTRYALSPLQAFVYPVPIENPTPLFPQEAWVDELPPTTVCVSLVVGAAGQVERVFPLQAPECAQSGGQPQLQQAALDAVAAWTFESALLCTYPDAASKARDRNSAGCNGEGVSAEAIPVTLSYAFVFEKHQGRAAVSARPAGTP